MKSKRKGGRVFDIEAYGIGQRVLGVYIRLSEGRVERTREVIADVFADFDRHGAILGLEFTRPGKYGIDAMQNVSRITKVQELRAIDVSRLPVNVQEPEPAHA
jgi:uncharacterized protein YuzE